MHTDLAARFACTVATAIPGILRRQAPDGSIAYDGLPLVYPQHAIHPLAYVFAGRDPERRWQDSPEVLTAIRRLGDFLVERYSDSGAFCYDSHGFAITGVDQRLTGAWTEALHLLRQAGADLPYAAWEDRILRACRTLIEHRLRKLAGIRRFIGHATCTGPNHVALYLTTVYRAGVVLGRPELCDAALPIARAFAADVNPDGYWEEHGDYARSGGPTGAYTQLSFAAMGLMHAWTGEAVFRSAVEAGTRFHSRFCHPDATKVELLDERVRASASASASVWGLFALSHCAEGRGAALAHFRTWLAHLGDPADAKPEDLARLCDNHQHWQDGPVVPAPFEQDGHTAVLSLPGGIFRRQGWSLGLSAMRASNAEDPLYRDNGFALDRQKLFSVWHPATGLLLDGSQSKHQPANSTFATITGEQSTDDCLPLGGAIGEEVGDLVVRAFYRSFAGAVRLHILSPRQLQVVFSVDPAAAINPIHAGFTLAHRAGPLLPLAGGSRALDAEPFRLDGAALGGGFRLGALTVRGPDDLLAIWPFEPWNSYAADHKPRAQDRQLRVSIPLGLQRRSATVIIEVDG